MLKKSVKNRLAKDITNIGRSELLKDLENYILWKVFEAVAQTSQNPISIALSPRLSKQLLSNLKALGVNVEYIEIELEKIRFLSREVV